MVGDESPNRIRDHFARTSRFNPTRSLTALTSQLAQEYEDRFLIELVQNAYDAHTPGTRRGRVHVLLDEASFDQAVLYVANTGNPFTDNNFDALTNVAQSSKPPGEGIGNKGVGFRSVLQVCEYPEIYSCHPGPSAVEEFDGFCFRFATDDDIRGMVANEAQFDTISSDFSRYLLPVGAHPDDPLLKDLRELGMVTVVRLPLVSERAVELARTQVQRLLTPSPPIALFLDRLVEITVEHDDVSGGRKAAVVDRSVEVIHSPGADLHLEWVCTLGERFLLASRLIPAGDLRRVAAEAVENGDLDRSWLAWDSNAHVSVAIRADTALDDQAEWPSSYTYLPMRVLSPLFAHLHAPFHTKMARLDLKEQSTFNSFLMAEVGDLVAETLASLAIDGATGLELRTRQAAVIDLLSWDANHIDILVAALERRGLSLDAWPVVPVMSAAGPTWVPLPDVRIWEEGALQVVTSERLQSHAALLEPTLGSVRRRRFADVCDKGLHADLAPSDNEVAGWIEAVALELGSRSIVQWNRFLSDVAALFSTRRVQALQRRKFLLDNQHKLRRSGPWESGDAKADPTVFLPPQFTTAATGDEEDEVGDDDLSAVPKNLQRAITFLHDGIRLRTREGSSFKRTPVGDLLNSGDLVERFELNAVLGHLERLLAGKASSTTYRQALSWVFAQEQASRANIADLTRVRLHVPTAHGWIPATEAVFSPDWDTPLARDLDSLVEAAAGTSPSLTQLGTSRIVSPTQWPFRLRDIDAFRNFLSRAGVRDGLHPSTLQARGLVRADGIRFTPEWITTRFGLARSETWEQHVNEVWRTPNFPYFLAGPNTPYTGAATLWTVPGRDAFEDLPSQAKDYLAICLLANIANWVAGTWRYEFRRRSPHHASKPDPQAWPSPAATFVEREPWFPMADAGRRDEHYFVPVEQGWTFDENTSETAPRFARLAPVEHRRRLAGSSGAQMRLDSAGLQTWNNPASANGRLSELTERVDSGELADADALSVQRGAARAWSDLVHHCTPALDDDLHLVVTRNLALTTLAPSPQAPSDVYVHDVPPGLAAHVLETSGFPVLVADPSDGALIADAISGIAGFTPRPTSTVDANIVLDRVRVVPAADTGVALLDVFEPWLVRTVLAVVDIRSTRFMRVTEKVLHDAEARLRRTRLVAGTAIEVDVDGQTIPAVGRLAECVHIQDDNSPLLALNTSDLELPSWQALAVIADDLAELMGQAQSPQRSGPRRSLSTVPSTIGANRPTQS